MDAAALELKLSLLAPTAVGFAIELASGSAFGLLEGEGAIVERAIEPRKKEFAAGRRAARRALSAIDIPNQPILADAERTPIWPAGTVGSISHANGVCAAVAAPSQAYKSLGLDIEQTAALDPDLWAEILTDRELSWLNTQAADDRGWLAKAIFSAKESAYKCQFPLTRTMFGFHQLQITFDLEMSEFEAEFLEGSGEFSAGDRLKGRLTSARDFVMCLAFIPC